MTDSLKVGLALGSGSSRGWAHIGIINALHDMDIEPEIICGCSVGGLVGAAYVAGHLSKLEDWVKSLTKLETARFFEVNFSLNGFVNKERFGEFLHEYVASDKETIESMSKTFATVSTELESGREKWFTEGNLINAVWATISLPGLFPPYKDAGKWMVDGGLVNPVPVSICRALGADVVIAANLNGDILGRHFDKKTQLSKKTKSDSSVLDSIKEVAREYSSAWFPKLELKPDVPGLLDTIASSINITQDRITRSRMAGDPPDILLRPHLSKIGLLEFYRGKEAIDEGYECVQRMQTELEHLIGK